MRSLLAMVVAITLAHPAAAAEPDRAHAKARRRSAPAARVSANGTRAHARTVRTSAAALDVELKISTPRGADREAAPPPEREAPPPARLDAPNASPEREAPPPAVLATAPERAAMADHDAGRQRRWGLFGGGIALLLGGYGLDIGLTFGIGHSPAYKSLIPIVGPLVQLGDNWSVVAPSTSGNAAIDQQANERIASVNHTVQIAAYCVLAVDFALQLSGATMAVVGAVGRGPQKYASGKRTVAFAPTPQGMALVF